MSVDAGLTQHIERSEQFLLVLLQPLICFVFGSCMYCRSRPQARPLPSARSAMLFVMGTTHGANASGKQPAHCTNASEKQLKKREQTCSMYMLFSWSLGHLCHASWPLVQVDTLQVSYAAVCHSGCYHTHFEHAGSYAIALHVTCPPPPPPFPFVDMPRGNLNTFTC